MSADVRAALAAAASSVDGINCSPYFRQSTKPGDAMVRFERDARDESGFGFMRTWQVMVMLPQDLAAAEKYLDANLDAIVAAVAEELVITTVTPQQLALDTGLVPCVLIEGVRAK